MKIPRFTSFPVIKITCTDESSCVLTAPGDVYVWGRNAEGMFDTEYGIFALDQAIEKPTLLKGMKAK